MNPCPKCGSHFVYAEEAVRDGIHLRTSKSCLDCGYRYLEYVVVGEYKHWIDAGEEEDKRTPNPYSTYPGG